MDTRTEGERRLENALHAEEWAAYVLDGLEALPAADRRDVLAGILRRLGEALGRMPATPAEVTRG